MTVHRKDTQKEVKSKIILPLISSAILLPKNRKIKKKSNNTTQITIDSYTKTKINTNTTSLKIQNISTKLYKVHSDKQYAFNKA